MVPTLQSTLSSPLLTLDDVSLFIPVEGVQTKSLKTSFVSGITGGFLRRGSSTEPNGVEILRSLSLSINHGERIALIGHNGAGKTSLIRLLCDIYCPTRGTLIRNGPIAPLINKSFWVDTDLNGYHAAKAHYLLNCNTIEGFEEYLFDLCSFTELSDFIHLPIRTYSEGMRTRLQFGLLTSFRHQALALDEGIGAGDQWFLSKARSRLSEFLGSIGTLILASHSSDLLRNFCERGLVLCKGQLHFDGPLEDALLFYHNELAVSV